VKEMHKEGQGRSALIAALLAKICVKAASTFGSAKCSHSICMLAYKSDNQTVKTGR